MRSVAVFCGSSFGVDPAYEQLARELGSELGRRGVRLVYGGGNVGLMGVVADATIAAGGQALGVIPRQLMDKELGHNGITELRITETMHERKAAMEQAAEGFIMLPGGFGTLDEFCEIITWAQLGIHNKPCAVLDVEKGYFTELLAFFDRSVHEGFVKPEHNQMILRGTKAAELLDAMLAWQPTFAAKWTTRDAISD